MGLTIDPDNELYRPGGQPEEVRGAHGQVVEPLGASTVPHTAPAGPAAFQPASDATLDGIDLDLELPLGGEAEPPLSRAELTQPLHTAEYQSDDTLAFELPDDTKTVPVKRPSSAALAAVPTTIALPSKPAPVIDEGLDFDLESLSGPEATAPAAPAAGAPSVLDFGDFGMAEAPTLADGSLSPLARKLDLAEEFRQIGDLEGARDLLEEVVAKGEGALRTKAQGMLDKLG